MADYIGIAEFDQIIASHGAEVDFWRGHLNAVTEKCGEIDATCALVKVFEEQLTPTALANMLVIAFRRLNDSER